jgi:hypothetical protein
MNMGKVIPNCNITPLTLVDSPPTKRSNCPVFFGIYPKHGNNLASTRYKINFFWGIAPLTEKDNCLNFGQYEYF